MSGAVAPGWWSLHPPKFPQPAGLVQELMASSPPRSVTAKVLDAEATLTLGGITLHLFAAAQGRQYLVSEIPTFLVRLFGFVLAFRNGGLAQLVP